MLRLMVVTTVLIGWIKSKKQGNKLDHYHSKIKKVYYDAKIDRSEAISPKMIK